MLTRRWVEQNSTEPKWLHMSDEPEISYLTSSQRTLPQEEMLHGTYCVLTLESRFFVCKSKIILTLILRNWGTFWWIMIAKCKFGNKTNHLDEKQTVSQLYFLFSHTSSSIEQVWNLFCHLISTKGNFWQRKSKRAGPWFCCWFSPLTFRRQMQRLHQV